MCWWKHRGSVPTCEQTRPWWWLELEDVKDERDVGHKTVECQGSLCGGSVLLLNMPSRFYNTDRCGQCAERWWMRGGEIKVFEIFSYPVWAQKQTLNTIKKITSFVCWKTKHKQNERRQILQTKRTITHKNQIKLAPPAKFICLTWLGLFRPNKS